MNDIAALMEAESAHPPASGVDLDRVLRKGRRRRRRRVFAGYAGATLTAVAVVAIALVAGNVLAPATTRQQAGGSPDAETGPEALLGVWAVTDTGERGEMKLRLNTRELRVVIGCGDLLGSWRANAAGQFLADVDGYTGGCNATYGQDARFTPPWLSEVVGFRLEGRRAMLLDQGGHVRARLAPRPDSDVPEVVPEAPEALAVFRAMSVNQAPLPAGLTPATAETLVGTWLPLAPGPTRPTVPSLRLDGDRNWYGSDGCNTMGGRWLAGPGGLIMSTGGMHTQIGCDNDLTAESFPLAQRAGFDGELLVLIGAGGTEIARLRHAS